MPGQPRLFISSLVIERLKKIEHSLCGGLLGIRKDNNSLSIVGFYVKNSIKTNSVSDDNKEVSDNEFYNFNIIPHVPANINTNGAFIVSVNDDVNKLETKVFESDIKLNPLLLIVDLDKDIITAKFKEDDKYIKIDYEVPNETYWRKFINFRVIGRLCTSFEFDYEAGKKALASLRDTINRSLAFEIKSANIFVFEKGADGPGITDKTTVNDLKSLASPKLNNEDNCTLRCEILLRNDSSELCAAPVITREQGKFKWTVVNIPIDALSLVDGETKVSKLHGIILESVRRNLTLSESWMLTDLKNADPHKLSASKIIHFFPEQIGHFITIAYPKKMIEEEMKQYRAVFHKTLSLPTNRPYFRPMNEHSFETVSSRPSKILSNPHEGLKPSGVTDGIVSFVQGRYDYHHYMQDGINDNGWGCAYRSLQTIISWYRYQGYYSKPIPTHSEIQKALVTYGDKSASFVGSTKWIGSIEVSYVLESLLGVSSRIVRVESGEEMTMKGGELSHHFKTQGSPIMIGGGVLAHTIIGVDYNKKTGELKFLVLDPHYTGEEDLSIIQGKGWCGWKGIDFWKKGNFYNMCLPQRPNDSNY